MKLITWNIQWCRGCDGRVDPQRIVAHARAFADFDVLCLQEVAANFPGLPGSAGEDQFQVLASLLPGYQAACGVAVDIPGAAGNRRRFGNLVLSRLPILRVLRHQLPWPPAGARAGMPRLLIEAVIQSPMGPVRVMTTHLEYFSAAHRAAQVEAIRRVHAQSCAHARRDARPDPKSPKRDQSGSPFQTLPQPAAAILTGDFNYKPDDVLHQRMQASPEDGASALLDSWSLANPGLAHQDTNGVHDREQWPSPYPCDFIYVSEELAPRVRRVAVDSQTQASDHQPVLIELA
jgi:endonuclease/exonuclease/phosphatase family metal-dependent hydrolase